MADLAIRAADLERDESIGADQPISQHDSHLPLDRAVRRRAGARRSGPKTGTVLATPTVTDAVRAPVG
jgi:hypothetical protein